MELFDNWSRIGSVDSGFMVKNHKTIIMFHYTNQSGIINTYNHLIEAFNRMKHANQSPLFFPLLCP